MKRSVKVMVVAAVLLLLSIGAWMADRKLKGHGHPGLQRFVQQLAVNYPEGFKVEPQVLEIEVKDADMQRLQQIVDDALARGVIIPEGNEYVPARIHGPEGDFKARIRIKGKLTDHVKGSKWSFRVLSRKDGGFMGMKRFSLQHPGTRNYLYDWFYHRLMKGEGIIALRYGFIRLKFNGDDLGIYAYEEHFGPELLEYNERLAGPIFRFDPGLFWQHRLNEMQKLRVDAPYAEFQAASVDAFGTNDMLQDTIALAEYVEAVSAIDAFRRGLRSASEVFDADLIARRHAVLDLIGGHHSMDFSDVKFYYDPIAKKVEPVAYESFSAFPIRTLAGSNRFTGEVMEDHDLHDAYFNDPEVFKLYVHHLERVSRPSYLDSIFTALAPALDTASATIYQEFPWKEMDRSIYYNNQKVIRRLLDVPKGFHAYSKGVAGDTMTVTAVPIDALPMEVHELLIGDSAYKPIVSAIVPCRKSGKMGIPVDLKFLVPDAIDSAAQIMKLSYSVLGASVKKELEVFPFALTAAEEIPEIGMGSIEDVSSFPFIKVDHAAQVIQILSGSWTLDRDLVFPAGFVVRAAHPLILDLQNGARFISRSPLDWKGHADQPIKLISSDEPGGSILLIGAEGSNLEHVEIGSGDQGEDPVLTIQKGNARLSNVKIGGRARTLILAVNAKVTMQHCTMSGGGDQFIAHYSEVQLSDLSAYGAMDDAITLNGGMAVLRNINVQNTGGYGSKLDLRAEVTVDRMTLLNVGSGVEVDDGSRMTWKNGKIEAKGVAFNIGKRSVRYGASTLDLEAVEVKAGEPERVGERSELRRTPPHPERTHQ
jgi:hypothetical protein